MPTRPAAERRRPSAAPGRGARRAGDEAASSSVIAFMVAGVLFVGSVATVLFNTQGAGGHAAADAPAAATMRVQARDLASVLLSSPGYGAAGDWADGANGYTGRTMSAEGLQRLGLLDDTGLQSNVLEYAKFQNLRRGKYAADPLDGYVDYEEAVRSLGLDAAGLDFHVRAYPALESVRDLLAHGARDRNLRVTYVGHYEVTYNTVHQAAAIPTEGLGVSNPVCYVSRDVSVSPSNTPPQGNPNTAAQNYRLEVNVTNGGQRATQFTALFTYKLGTSSTAYQGTRTAQSFLVQPGATTNLFVDIPARSGVSCAAGSTITAKVSEPYGNSVTKSATLATGVTDAKTVTAMRDLYVESGLSVYTTASCSSAVELNWLSPVGDVGPSDFLGMKVVNRNTGAQVWPASGFYTFKANTGNKAKLDSVCLAPGEYRAYLYYSGGNSFTDTSQHIATRVYVASTAPSGYLAPGVDVVDYENPIYTDQPPVQVEAGYLDQLVDRFCPAYYSDKARSPLVGSGTAWTQWDARCGGFAGGRSLDTQSRCKTFGRDLSSIDPSQPGDVIPDIKCDMDNSLPARLICQLAAGCPGAGPGGTLAPKDSPRFDIANVLVVGSKVSQASMTSGAAKFAVRDWVLGGGTLVVFGSDAQNVNWLEPLFHAAIRSGSDAISVPDISHPILHTPDELDDPAHAYDARGQAWNFNGQTAQAQGSEGTALFSNVIVEGNALTGNPLLAESKPGSVGNGSIILTTYLPYDLYGDDSRSDQPSSGPGACPGLSVGPCESLKFIHNLLVSGYADLYLDYGPQCPPQTNCIPHVRSAQIRHPDFTDPIQLQLNVFVFPS